jgi:hypothetical protein
VLGATFDDGTVAHEVGGPRATGPTASSPAASSPGAPPSRACTTSTRSSAARAPRAGASRGVASAAAWVALHQLGAGATRGESIASKRSVLSRCAGPGDARAPLLPDGSYSTWLICVVRDNPDPSSRGTTGLAHHCFYHQHQVSTFAHHRCCPCSPSYCTSCSSARTVWHSVTACT